MDETAFHVYITILCVFMGIIWETNSTIFNVAVKFLFWMGAIGSIIMCLKDLGYLIKI